jgi:hypothetical protein
MVFRIMQMLFLRNIALLDTETLAPGEAREALFRDRRGYLLYLSTCIPSLFNEERIIRLGAREALIWLNEGEWNQGSFWG